MAVKGLIGKQSFPSDCSRVPIKNKAYRSEGRNGGRRKVKSIKGQMT